MSERAKAFIEQMGAKPKDCILEVTSSGTAIVVKLPDGRLMDCLIEDAVEADELIAWLKTQGAIIRDNPRSGAPVANVIFETERQSVLMTANKGKSTRMRGEAAIAFAAHAFELKHPRHTWPEWVIRRSGASVSLDKGRFIVSLSLTPKGRSDPVAYFEAAVDAMTGDTTILVDTDLSEIE